MRKKRLFKIEGICIWFGIISVGVTLEEFPFYLQIFIWIGYAVEIVKETITAERLILELL